MCVACCFLFACCVLFGVVVGVAAIVDCGFGCLLFVCFTLIGLFNDFVIVEQSRRIPRRLTFSSCPSMQHVL